MTKAQVNKYQKLIDKYTNDLNSSGQVLEDDEFENSEEVKRGAAMLMDLRKAANHPLLLRTLYTDVKLRKLAKAIMVEDMFKEEGNEQYIFEDMQQHNDFEMHLLCKKHASLNSHVLKKEQILESGKFQVLDEMLPKLKADKKRVLLFSQFVMMLDVIVEYLDIRGHKYIRLDGGTKVSDRLDLIDDFNSADSEIFIFLLSTKAGGMGINLTAATEVIIHDIDFNPYNDKQAEDRCHRVGQTKEVTVTRLISQDTVEEGMLAIAEKKLKLGEDLCDEQSKLRTLVINVFFGFIEKKSSMSMKTRKFAMKRQYNGSMMICHHNININLRLSMSNSILFITGKQEDQKDMKTLLQQALKTKLTTRKR